MRYKDQWDDLTTKMGYWVDLDAPYVTYENEYIESVWYLLKELYKKDLIYKGYTIQPFSPAAGTGLSSHELNQPGTYKDVKDVSAVAQFKIKRIRGQLAVNVHVQLINIYKNSTRITESVCLCSAWAQLACDACLYYIVNSKIK